MNLVDFFGILKDTSSIFELVSIIVFIIFMTFYRFPKTDNKKNRTRLILRSYNLRLIYRAIFKVP